MPTKQGRLVPASYAAKILGLICLTIWLFPLYQDGMTSLLSRVTGIEQTEGNKQMFAVAGFSIWVPIAFAWRRSRWLGAAIRLRCCSG